jgi:hypothetical protein
MTRILPFLLCPALALAQAGTWSSPRLGYFFDPDVKAIRVVSGVPGAAGADQTLAFASKLQAAWVAPSGSYALATLFDSPDLQLLAWTRGNPHGSTLEQAIQPTLVAFSPGGSAALLWNQETARLQVWSGLPNSPSLARQAATPLVNAAAVSDDGSLIALVDDAGAALVSRSGDVQHLPFATSVQFLRDSADLVASFASTNQVSLIHNAGPHAETRSLAGAGEGISGPTSMALAGSSRQLAVANTDGRSVTVIDLDTSQTTTLPCECTPRVIAPLAGSSVFRISGDALFVLDRMNGVWRLTSVPFHGGNR